MIPFAHDGQNVLRIGSPGEGGEQTGQYGEWPWGKDDVRRYRVIDGVPVPLTPVEVAALPDIPLKESEIRKNEIIAEREAAGLRAVTVQQARDYIDNTLDAATTAAETKQAIRVILKRMIPYILEG